MAMYAMVLASLGSAQGQDLFLSRPRETHCPPKEWMLQMYNRGHWILDYTDSSWDAYMEFLGLDKGAWPTERNTSDIHEYFFAEDGSSYVMNHTIPLSDFHLMFKTEVGTAQHKPEWSWTPYLDPTPAGFNPDPLKLNMTLWRNFFEEPGKPFPESCHALRTQTRGTYNESGALSEVVVDFTGELTSPYEWRYSLHVWNWTTGEILEPWKSQLKDATPHPDVSYRYFKKATQSFGDALAKNPCGELKVDGQVYDFC